MTAPSKINIHPCLVDVPSPAPIYEQQCEACNKDKQKAWSNLHDQLERSTDLLVQREFKGNFALYEQWLRSNGCPTG